jgi:hypothetical protein
VAAAGRGVAHLSTVNGVEGMGLSFRCDYV